MSAACWGDTGCVTSARLRGQWLLDMSGQCRGNAARPGLSPEVRAGWLDDAEVLARAAERLLQEAELAEWVGHLSLAPMEARP